MYQPLTKVVIIDGKECVTCAKYGTEECLIHKEKVSGCFKCRCLGAMVEQLHAFEEVFMELRDRKADDNLVVTTVLGSEEQQE